MCCVTENNTNKMPDFLHIYLNVCKTVKVHYIYPVKYSSHPPQQPGAKYLEQTGSSTEGKGSEIQP